jgi:hypothetical protein
MALGIDKDSVYTTLSIPLIGGSDKEWSDNTWICEHLHQLADKIKETNIRIISVSIETGVQHPPCLVIKGFEGEEPIIAKAANGITISSMVFAGLSNKEKWEIAPHLINVQWCCSHCGNPIKKKMPQMVKVGEVDQCSHCYGILTHYTKDDVDNPFNYVFRVVEGED